MVTQKIQIVPVNIFRKFPEEIQLRKLIVWLEENIIKKWDKKFLEQSVNSANWQEAFNKYKSIIGCPNLANLLEEVEWILGLAVQIEYAKNSKCVS